MFAPSSGAALLILRGGADVSHALFLCRAMVRRRIMCTKSREANRETCSRRSLVAKLFLAYLRVMRNGCLVRRAPASARCGRRRGSAPRHPNSVSVLGIPVGHAAFIQDHLRHKLAARQASSGSVSVLSQACEHVAHLLATRANTGGAASGGAVAATRRALV